MHKFLVIALLISSAAALPVATPAFANSSNSALCGPDAPEGYKRPGGFCEQLDNNKSMIEGPDCEYDLKLKAVSMLEAGKPVLVAEYCYEIKKVEI